jgi:HK97 family phage major capsid protein
MATSIGRERTRSLTLAPTSVAMAPRTTDQLLDDLERIGRRGGRRSSSYAEFRSGRPASEDGTRAERAFWKNVTAPRELDVAEKRSLSKATGAGGGFLVPTDFADQLLEALAFWGPLGRLASEFKTASGDDLPVPIDSSQGTASWVAEAGLGTPSDEVFSQVTFKAYRGTTSIVVSEELLADGKFDLDVFLASKLGKRISLLEESAFVNGSGSGQPTGILPALTVVTALPGNSTTFDWPSLVALAFSVPPQFRPSSSFIMSDGARRNVALLRDSQGLPIVAGDLLLGYPMFVSPDMPAPAANAKSIMFGSWPDAYGVRRVAELGLQRLSEIRSASGQVEFRLVERVDGQPLVTNAARALAGSAT